MKKIFMLFGVLMLIMNAAMAQTCPFKVQFSVTDATCYNNGKVAYALTDGSGNVLTSLPDGMSNVRIYYKTNESDSANYGGWFYDGGWDTLTINYGTYIVGLEAMCSDGNGGYVKKDTSTILTINTSYVKPSIASIYTTAKDTDDFGKRPTLNCTTTGRVQLKIENGAYPYTVTVIRHGTNDTLRQDIFPERQYSGTDPLLYNYKDYYTMDGLPGGDWDFYMVDGCGYGMPRTGQTVEVIHFPELDYVNVYASADGYQLRDSNVVKIDAVLDADFSYYSALLPEYVSYRFVYDGHPGSDADWKPFPAIASGFSATLYDTLETAHSYCDIWERDITLQYKISECSDTTIERTFHYYKPNRYYFEKDYSDFRDSTFIIEGACTDMWYWHRHYYSIHYTRSDYEHLNEGDDHPYYRHHYTKPTTWIYTDTRDNSIIQKDTVVNISQLSLIYDYTIVAKYGSFKDTPLSLPVERKLVDAKGCVLYSDIDTLLWIYDIGEEIVDWKMYTVEGDNCCRSRNSISIRENHTSHVDPDGTIVRLVTSPYNNRYNFEAVFSSETHGWTVTRNNVLNIASINGGSNGKSFYISDYCLPSGHYTFIVITPCDTFVLEKNISFPSLFVTEMVEEPEFTYYQLCTDRYISYTKGLFVRKSYNTSPYTGLDLPPVIDTLSTTFQIISGPTGGYDSTLHYLNEPIRISMAGTYVVKITPSTSLKLCETLEFYDTIDYSGGTPEFVYALALVCDTTCEDGHAYVLADEGTPPYTYTLYSGPDLTGSVISVNDNGIFYVGDMRSSQQMSCQVKDDCGAYFHVNFFPQTLSEMQKVWFDNGLTAMTTCEGSTIQVHALEIGSLLSYEWTGPNGFTSTSSNPYIVVPRNVGSGWYKVNILNTGCTGNIVDSLYLTVEPAPTLDISQSDTVCPGEEVELSFVANSSQDGVDSLTVTVAYENAEGLETRTYRVAKGETFHDTYTTFSDAKIYSVLIDDGHCDYTYADEGDTIYIRMSENIPDICTLLSLHDTVCYGGNAHLEAQSTIDAPYVIRWYTDYEQTNLLKEDNITASGLWSTYDTTGITQRTILYVSIEQENGCPTVNGTTTNVMNMTSGADTTTLACGESYRFYDSGGNSGNYRVRENNFQIFKTSDGMPVTMHFDALELAEGSFLYIFTGTETVYDSLLYRLSFGSSIPQTISSRGDALTFYFMSTTQTASGWSAVVEHSPGIAIADVWKKNSVTYRDTVCQNKNGNYYGNIDIYNKVVPSVVNSATLSEAVLKSGVYTYTKTFEGADKHNCDSTVIYTLVVNTPPYHDTLVVTTNLLGGSYTWHDSVYSTSGQHVYNYTTDDGCDSLDILNLVILSIDTSDNEICIGDSTTVGVFVSSPDVSFITNSTGLPQAKAVGDVLCTDGAILRPDSFLTSGKTAKGVVFYIDNTGEHGLAVALTDTVCNWALENIRSQINGEKRQAVHYASQDTAGMNNTLTIKQSAENIGSRNFKENAPAAYFCYYYDHNTHSSGSTPLGWYLPAAGELYVLVANRVPVNATLAKLGDEYMFPHLGQWSYEGFWSSTSAYVKLENPTRYGYYYAWGVFHLGKSISLEYGPTFRNSGKEYSQHVRPIIKF